MISALADNNEVDFFMLFGSLFHSLVASYMKELLVRVDPYACKDIYCLIGTLYICFQRFTIPLLESKTKGTSAKMGEYVQLWAGQISHRNNTPETLPGRVLLTDRKSTTQSLGPAQKSYSFISRPGFGLVIIITF